MKISHKHKVEKKINDNKNIDFNSFDQMVGKTQEDIAEGVAESKEEQVEAQKGKT